MADEPQEPEELELPPRESPGAEADPRFPSGPWDGFFLDRRMPGRHFMELHLSFSAGELRGTGRDRVGPFEVRGGYDVTAGTAHFAKTYPGSHSIRYQGYNEGKGIWGTWTLHWPPMVLTGGFHIWPRSMGDPSQQKLRAEADLPAETDPTTAPTDAPAELAPA